MWSGSNEITTVPQHIPVRSDFAKAFGTEKYEKMEI